MMPGILGRQKDNGQNNRVCISYKLFKNQTKSRPRGRFLCFLLPVQIVVSVNVYELDQIIIDGLKNQSKVAGNIY